MKTTLKSKMLLALVAATAVTLLIATPSFGDDRGRDGDNRGYAVRDRNRDRDKDRDRDPGRNRNSGGWNDTRPFWHYQPRDTSPPVVYCAPVRTVLPRRPYVVVRPPLIVIRSVPVCSSIGFWFGW
jgi:hypothetical protein